MSRRPSKASHQDDDSTPSQRGSQRKRPVFKKPKVPEEDRSDESDQDEAGTGTQRGSAAQRAEEKLGSEVRLVKGWVKGRREVDEQIC